MAAKRMPDSDDGSSPLTIAQPDVTAVDDGIPDDLVVPDTFTGGESDEGPDSASGGVFGVDPTPDDDDEGDESWVWVVGEDGDLVRRSYGDVPYSDGVLVLHENLDIGDGTGKRLFMYDEKTDTYYEEDGTRVPPGTVFFDTPEPVQVSVVDLSDEGGLALADDGAGQLAPADTPFGDAAARLAEWAPARAEEQGERPPFLSEEDAEAMVDGVRTVHGTPAEDESFLTIAQPDVTAVTESPNLPDALVFDANFGSGAAGPIGDATGKFAARPSDGDTTGDVPGIDGPDRNGDVPPSFLKAQSELTAVDDGIPDHLVVETAFGSGATDLSPDAPGLVDPGPVDGTAHGTDETSPSSDTRPNSGGFDGDGDVASSFLTIAQPDITAVDDTPDLPADIFLPEEVGPQ